MSVLYNDARTTYDQANLTYNGMWLAPLAGAQPAATGQLTTVHKLFRSLSGAQPAATATLAGGRKILRSLTGAQSPATATLTRSQRRFSGLSGSQPYATALLATRTAVKRTLTGAQPYPTGALPSTIRARKTALAGAVASAASGVVTDRVVIFKPVSGSQPAATSTLTTVRSHRFTVSDLAGAPDVPTGELATRTAHRVTLTGAQPAATGTVRGNRTYLVTLTGFQSISQVTFYDDPRFTYEEPGVSYNGFTPGVLTYRGWFSRQMAGEQDPATGTLVRLRLQWPWAEYYPSETDRPEEVTYTVSVDTDDQTLRYQTTSSGGSQGVAYVVRAPIQNPERRG